MTARKFIHAPEPPTPEQIARLVAVICARVPQGWQKIAPRVRAALGASDAAIKAAIWEGVDRRVFAVKLVARTDSRLVHGGSLVGARVSVIERTPAPEPAAVVTVAGAEVGVPAYMQSAAWQQQIARCRAERGGAFRPQGLGGAMTVHEPAAVLDGRTAP